MEDSPERLRQVLSLFEKTVKLPAEERTAFLEAAAGGDADMVSRVTSLLKSDQRTTEILEKPLMLGSFPDPARGDEPPGDAGPFRLLRKIGEGGMGEVWLGEQTTPIRRQAAVKVIKSGMDTRAVIVRFEAERQALALMDHPAIARVFDAGATSRGLPYFTMEYVKGAPITTYCDRNRLTTRERLDLFVLVCDGVQHAHQKGIIHRDLKPSNVLVTLQDGRPVPKIIDFGVAKATAQRLTEQTMFTAKGIIIGTPEYMSPEQAGFSERDVDTRTDVYAMGMILYQLLVGALPFDTARLREAGYEEVLRRIREVEPPRPSARISTLGEAAKECALNRKTDPAGLAAMLRGDLDWITMKALEKDRARRYGSPSDLAADVGRHLAHEPVLAGPPSTAYRARKFVRRHRIGVGVVSLAAVALVAFAATMAVQAQRIARERNRAERVSQFLVGLFKVSDPGEARGNAVTAREILDKGVEQIGAELESEPEVQAQLMLTMGRVYTSLGLYQKALPILEQALATRRRVRGDEDLATLEVARDLGLLYARLHRVDDAEKLFTKTLEAVRRRGGENHPQVTEVQAGLAYVYYLEGRHDDQEAVEKKILEARRRTNGPDHPRTLESMDHLAIVARMRGRYDDAEKRDREVLEARRRILGNDHPETLGTISNLALDFELQRRYPEAETLFREVLETQRRVLGNEHPDVFITMTSLAAVFDSEGRYAEAETLDLEVYAGRRRVLGEEHPLTLQSLENVAIIRGAQGRRVEAEATLLQALEQRRRIQGEDHTDTLKTMYNLACFAAADGDRGKALDWLDRIVAHGFRYADMMANDTDLEPLRGDPRFEALLAAARKNAEGGN